MPNTYEQLMRPMFDQFVNNEGEADPPSPAEPAQMAQSPRQAIAERPRPETEMAQIHRWATDKLKAQLLARIYSHDHVFFESLIIDLMLAMGYGARRRELARRLGRSHDGGIDGAIAQDELGLDVILLQAKRLKPGGSVSGSQVRDFVGSLEAHQAHKGIFVTTGKFTLQAKAATRSISRRVALVNGDDLTGLMIRHNIGVRSVQAFEVKTIEAGYFSRAGGAAKAAAPGGYGC